MPGWGDVVERAVPGSRPNLERTLFLETVHTDRSHTQLICRPSGYSLEEVAAPPPSIGERVEVVGEVFVVDCLAPSPFPADTRRCAILVPA